MEDKLILLERKNPEVYEIHRFEISQTKNLILSTTDLEFAVKLVGAYNKLNHIDKPYKKVCHLMPFGEKGNKCEKEISCDKCGLYF